jgi:DNA-binding response OmpR family regulator
VRLSVRGFELLVAIARRIGVIATREQLYETVWRDELRFGDRSIDVYVSTLRKKLQAAMPDHRFIHTHPGFGYRFQQGTAREPSAVGLPATATGKVDADQVSRNVHTGIRRN